MYLIICVEWADDHFVLDLTQIGPLLTGMCNNDIYIFIPSDLDLLDLPVTHVSATNFKFLRISDIE